MILSKLDLTRLLSFVGIITSFMRSGIREVQVQNLELKEKEKKLVVEQLDGLNTLIIQASELQPQDAETEDEVTRFILDLNEKIESVEEELQKIDLTDQVRGINPGFLDTKAQTFFHQYKETLQGLVNKANASANLTNAQLPEMLLEDLKKKYVGILNEQKFPKTLGMIKLIEQDFQENGRTTLERLENYLFALRDEFPLIFRNYP